MIFSVFQKFGFLGILGLPYCGISATIRIGQEMLCLPYAGFFCLALLKVLKKICRTRQPTIPMSGVAINIKNPAYGQHSALPYLCNLGVPILHHESMSIPWVLSTP